MPTIEERLPRTEDLLEIQQLFVDYARHVDYYHLISNPIVQLNGDRATAEVMWTVVRSEGEDRAIVLGMGRHKDDLVREKGQWRFLNRQGILDLPSPINVR